MIVQLLGTVAKKLGMNATQKNEGKVTATQSTTGKLPVKIVARKEAHKLERLHILPIIRRLQMEYRNMAQCCSLCIHYT